MTTSGKLEPAIRVVMMPRDTNPMGTIFGGIILSHIDVAGAMEARWHSEKMLVTVAMHEVKFIAPVFVGDAGLDLIETEEFIGVVNELDATGHHPKVNHFWRPEFGSDYVTPGGIRCHVTLLPWSSQSPRLRGYVGRVGGIAVTVFTAPASSHR